ncbi:MAG: hypothetical protein ACTSSK_08000 [Candidatus Heimdallarchaeota archaeon]
MSHSYPNSDKVLEEQIGIPRLLSNEYVYCPICGTKNFAKKETSLRNLKCVDCLERLNDHWEKYRNGQIKTAKCISCLESTFEPYHYCISCGYKQKKQAGTTLHEDKGIGSFEKVGLKAKFAGREKAWLAFVNCAVFGGIIMFIGVVLIFPFSIYFAFENGDLSNILGFTGMGLILFGFVFGMIPASIISSVVTKNYKKELGLEPVNDKPKIREIV